MTEGAKEKTSDGMTPDAKHFRHDLHKVQDAGFKHMVQKDSETKDYEKMFKPAIDKMPTRLSDVEPDQGVDKYVEYNEAFRVTEAKKHMKGCTCDACMNKEEKAEEKSAAKSDKKIAETYEIEINGQSYFVSEAHAAAIAAYVDKYGQINEKSDPNVGKFISKEMEYPDKLTAQGKKQKIKQAIAIYYSKKRHGEKP
jgi:hypothetical protein